MPGVSGSTSGSRFFRATHPAQNSARQHPNEFSRFLLIVDHVYYYTNALGAAEVIMKSVESRRRAFTIVEILVVVVIVAILAAFVVAATKLARNSANRATCASNLHQIGVAVQAYASANTGEIPAVYGLSYSHGRPMAWGNPGLHKDGIGCGGLLLLVNQPDGLAGQGALPDRSL